MGSRLVPPRPHPLHALQVSSAELLRLLLVYYVVVLLIEIGLKHLQVRQLLVASHCLLIAFPLDAASDSLERELILLEGFLAALAQLRLRDLPGGPAGLLVGLDLYLEPRLLLEVFVSIIDFAFALHFGALFLYLEAVE